MSGHEHASEFSLYARDGARKYLNREERERVLAVMQTLPPDQALFCFTLAWSGARVSEVLALTPASFQIESGVVALKTLKRRKHVVREVPLPPYLMTSLDRHFVLSRAQDEATHRCLRLWPWCRVTAWRLVKRIMADAQITGPRASPRGLRHAFAIGALQAGVPLNLAQRWLGHARIDTTAIYAAASGPEEKAFAARQWELLPLHACSE